MEEQRHHENCASNQALLGPIDLEQSHATEIGMEDLEQRQNEDFIPNPSPLGPLEPKHNGIGTRHYEPNLPEFDVLPSEVKDKMWGSISQRSFCEAINKIYDEIVHFRRNIFNIPSGRAGNNFIGELTFWLKQFKWTISLEFSPDWLCKGNYLRRLNFWIKRALQAYSTFRQKFWKF
jgi:hypothetical protein